MGFLRARGLYAIIDPEHCGGRDPVAVARAVVSGGCAALQLRAKGLSDRHQLALARRLRAVARSAEVPFVLNDRADLALLCCADGVHLGQDDLPPAEVRRMVGNAMAIGVSTHDADQARRAVEEGADVIGFGPVFETRTKERPDPVVGLTQLREVIGVAPVPVVAIGGITPERAADVMAAGAPLQAAISAIGAADDPQAAALALHRAAGGEP